MSTSERKLPYRLELKAADDELLRRLNREQRRRGARKFEPAAAAIERMQYSKGIKRPRLLTFIQHPDEHVLHHMLKTERSLNLRLYIGPNGELPEISQWSGQECPDYNLHKQLSRWLSDRIVEDAIAAGELWNPLLDQLDQVQPEKGTKTVFKKGSRYEEANFFGGFDFRIQCIERLKEWIRTQADPEDILPLFEFQSSKLRKMLFEEAPHLFGVALCAMLLKGKPSSWDVRNMFFYAPSAVKAGIEVEDFRALLRQIEERPEDVTYGVVETLLKIDQIRSNEDTLRILMKTRHVGLEELKGLYKAAPPSIARESFQRIAERDPLSAVSLLEKRIRNEVLHASDFIPLLKKDEMIRRRTMPFVIESGGAPEQMETVAV